MSRVLLVAGIGVAIAVVALVAMWWAEHHPPKPRRDHRA